MKKIIKLIFALTLFCLLLHGVSRLNYQVSPIECNMCGRCMNSCPNNAIVPDPELMCMRIDQSLCDGCGSCVSDCPRGAFYAIDGRSFIFGRITNTETNFAISGVTVSNGTDTVVTDRYGEYSFTVTQGSYTITATSPNFDSVVINDITLGADDANRLNINMSPTTSNAEHDVAELNSIRCFPNPCGEDVMLKIEFGGYSDSLLMVSNIKGQIVLKTRINGSFEWDWKDTNGHKLPSGIYFVNIYDGRIACTRKILLK